MISGFNHENNPENGKPAILHFENGTLLMHNVDGKFVCPGYEIVDNKIVKKSDSGTANEIHIHVSEIRTGGGSYDLESDIVEQIASTKNFILTVTFDEGASLSSYITFNGEFYSGISFNTPYGNPEDVVLIGIEGSILMISVPFTE